MVARVRGTEAKAEGFHLHIEIASRPKVAQLVDIDHHPDQYEEPKNVFKKADHI